MKSYYCFPKVKPVALEMLFAFESCLNTVACLVVRGLSSTLNKVNEKVKWKPFFSAKLGTCDKEFHAASFPCRTQK